MAVPKRPYSPRRRGAFEVTNLISIGIAAAIGAAVGAVIIGAASAVTQGDIPGLAVALQHIPASTHGYDVVTAVRDALLRAAAGRGKRRALCPRGEGRSGCIGVMRQLNPPSLFLALSSFSRL